MHVNNARCTWNHFAWAYVEMLFSNISTNIKKALKSAGDVSGEGYSWYDTPAFQCPFSYPGIHFFLSEYSVSLTKIRQYESKMDCDCLVSFYRQDKKCGQGHLCLLRWFSALRTHLHLQIYCRAVVSQFSIPCLPRECLQYTSLQKKHSHSSISRSINKLLLYHDCG